MSYISQITQPDGTKLRVSLRDTEANAVPVAVSVASMPLPAGAATAANQTGGNQKTQVVDGSGNVIGSEAATDGGYHVRSSLIQHVEDDSNNSSTTNLDVGNSYTFTGLKTSTLGVAGIQVCLYANQNCKIQVQQSGGAGTNWDLVNTYYYTSGASFGITVQAILSWVRVVVITNNLTTTTFRLSTVLCPIVEAVPQSLDYNGNFRVSTATDDLNLKAANTMMSEMRVAHPVRLVGAVFEGTTIDPRFWTTAATAAPAAIAQANSQITITSGTANGATVTMYSARRARYVAGHSIRYRGIIQVEAGVANNVRRWGIGWGASMPTVTDGAWFQFNGTTFGCVVMKGTTPTTITSFNGNHGATFTVGTDARTYEIYWSAIKVYFVVDGTLLHVHTAASDTWANTKHYHIFADSVNSAILGASVTLKTRTASIHRLGPLETEPQYYNLTGVAATHIIKYGAGKLKRIIFNNTSGTSFIIYDNSAGSGSIIGTITTASAALGSWDYECPFFNGLTIVTTGNSLDLTVVYE